MKTDPGPAVESFYHALTGAYAFLAFDAPARRAVIIDPVLDFERRSGHITTQSADLLLERVRELDLSVDWVLETHAHADHLSAAAYIKDRLGCGIATGAGICAVQATAARMFDFGSEFATDGSQFDRLLSDGDRFNVGGLVCSVLATPGHTPDSVSYLIGDSLFAGDTLFLPDVGTARCDFPGGSSEQLFASVRKLYRLPDATRVMVGHDYPPPTRDPVHSSDILSERQANVHLNESVASQDFIAFRDERDRCLPLPDLFYFALQVNVRAGRLPPPEASNTRHFRVPICLPKDWKS